MALNRRILIRNLIISALTVSLLTTIYFIYFTPESFVKSPEYISQTKVDHAIKIEIKPTYLVKNEPAIFNLYLESFEHSEMVDQNLLKICLLVDNNNTPYIPIDWQLTKKTAHSIHGSITFPTLTKEVTSVTLSVFLFDETEFVFYLQN